MADSLAELAFVFSLLALLLGIYLNTRRQTNALERIARNMEDE